MTIFTVTIKDGPDLYHLNVFACSAEEALETANIKIHFGRAIKAVRARK
jgi:hypothetical protein